MSSIAMKLVAHGDSRLKVVWGVGDGVPLFFDHYFVFRAQIEGCVQRCRVQLDHLVSAFLAGAFDRYKEILANLALEGSNLFYLLFEGAAEGRDYAVDTVKPWLLAIEAPSQLTIFSDASLQVPWNLVFEGNDDALPGNSARMEDYAGFWALKYKLAVLYSGMAPKSLRTPRERESFRALTVLNRDLFAAACHALPESELAVLERYLIYPEGSAESRTECRGKWALLENNDCLLYFFAHASGEEIELSACDSLTIVELKRRFFEPRRRNRAKIPESLIILNGCKTAIGKLDNSFLTATSDAGCCGFIGSEADLPTRFALRFGMALFERILYQGLSAMEALDQLRRQHWPLGMLYSCYSHPDFRVAPNLQVRSDPIPPELNLSYER